ncbi:MAG: PDZ domain-containing protein [Candidatus Kapabacteria bacterium]|nr:PDZ domain-containing protein [Candidatus Kapabacteria bacterium]
MRSFIGGIVGLALATSGLFAQTTSSAGQQNSENILAGPSARPSAHKSTLTRALGIIVDSSDAGVVITEVSATMPAYEAGLCRGDILLAVDRRPVTSVAQATALTRNLAVAYVMVDFQRRDMRISRRVYVADGRRETIGTARDGRAAAIALRQVSSETIEEVEAFANNATQRATDTIIIDLRGNPEGSHTLSRDVAQRIARLGSQSEQRNGNGRQLIVLTAQTPSEIARVMTSILADEGLAEVITEVATSMISRDIGQSAVTGPVASFTRREVTRSSAAAQAPVYWSMAQFRERYPQPQRQAMLHPMMAAMPAAASIAWGLNGQAWDALESVRTM